jgi:hypothetical protein
VSLFLINQDSKFMVLFIESAVLQACRFGFVKRTHGRFCLGRGPVLPVVWCLVAERKYFLVFVCLSCRQMKISKIAQTCSELHDRKRIIDDCMYRTQFMNTPDSHFTQHRHLRGVCALSEEGVELR